ncbi:MAG: hypothetical protein Q9209_004656 [Squamulea sp. 1 TL-2023]
MSSSGFDSQISTLIVGLGEEEKSFTGHASYLSQSPVFDFMCNDQILERHTLQIRLPEDSPEVIEAFIHYHYTGNFSDYGTVAGCGNPESAVYQLAEIYCVAEKYGLEDLKTLIVEKSSTVINIDERVSVFLEVARQIYERTPDSNVTYCKFFKDKLYEMQRPSQMSELDRQTFDDCISGGGYLAIDIVVSLCCNYEGDLSNVRAQL